jgi:hypothetical protein
MKLATVQNGVTTPIEYDAQVTLGDYDYSYRSLEIMAENGELPDGVIVIAPEPPTLAARREEVKRMVDVIRDLRIDSGFSHQGHDYQSRPSDRENIMGAAQSASFAIASGAETGDLRWADPNTDFVWIAADNQLVPMDPWDVLALFQRGVQFKSAQTFYARALKDAIEISESPESIEINEGWPT